MDYLLWQIWSIFYHDHLINGLSSVTNLIKILSWPPVLFQGPSRSPYVLPDINFEISKQTKNILGCLLFLIQRRANNWSKKKVSDLRNSCKVPKYCGRRLTPIGYTLHLKLQFDLPFSFRCLLFHVGCIDFMISLPQGPGQQDPLWCQKRRPFVESQHGLGSSGRPGTQGQSRGCPWRRFDPDRSWRTLCTATYQSQTALKLPKSRWWWSSFI